MPDAQRIEVLVIAEKNTDTHAWSEVVNALAERPLAAHVLTANGDLENWDAIQSGSPGTRTLVVVHGDAFSQRADSLRGIVQTGRTAWAFVEARPPAGFARDDEPVMILRGRQSEKLPHAEAVRAFEGVPRGRLIELENCDHEPHRRQPGAVAMALAWFATTFLTDGASEAQAP